MWKTKRSLWEMYSLYCRIPCCQGWLRGTVFPKTLYSSFLDTKHLYWSTFLNSTENPHNSRPGIRLRLHRLLFDEFPGGSFGLGFVGCVKTPKKWETIRTNYAFQTGGPPKKAGFKTEPTCSKLPCKPLTVIDPFPVIWRGSHIW